jgi:SAM-dependent methyltransferase
MPAREDRSIGEAGHVIILPLREVTGAPSRPPIPAFRRPHSLAAMDDDSQQPVSQVEYWGGAGGRRWVALQDLLDDLYRPLEDRFVDAVVEADSGGRVLDVGCGTGATTVAAAQRLGDGGDCTGVDVSGPMLAAARERAQREGVGARFVEADAQRHAFEAATFDVVASRFGVMFFDDPVAAFANLRRATRRGGALRAIVWRSPEDNPFMTTSEHAAAGLVTFPPKVPDAPGPFAFADPNRVRGILEGSGWTDVGFERIDEVCSMDERDLAHYVGGLGSLGRALADADEATRDRVVKAVLPAYEPYVAGGQARFNAACWLVSARA